MARRAGVKIRTKIYNQFKGVDFSTDPALVADYRSPWAPNMKADMGGMPEKRNGFIEAEKFSGAIYAIFEARFDGYSDMHMLVHAGTQLIELSNWYHNNSSRPYQQIVLATDLPNKQSVAVFLNNFLWIFTGEKLYRYGWQWDGEDESWCCREASDIAYRPLTVIARTPAGGGEPYEAVNLLTGAQRVRFLADGTSRVYYLPYTGIDSVDAVTVDGTDMTSGWSADLNAGTVTFTTAPAAPAAGAEDNVEIAFTKNVEGYADKINKCNIAFCWGAYGASDRIVAAEANSNIDHICAYNDPSYWPDINYAIIGNKTSDIVGYRRAGDALAVFKDGRGEDATVYIRTTAETGDGETIFPVKPCLSGSGAISRFGFGNIGNEQLILTTNGIYALTSNNITAEKITQNRSYRIDAALTKEPSLKIASCCNWRDWLLTFVGSSVYILDGRQAKYYTNRNDTDYIYECYHWKLPGSFLVTAVETSTDWYGRDRLYFGTSDGRLCLFKMNDYAYPTGNISFDGGTHKPYSDEYTDDGTLTAHAIEAYWSTINDDDGDPMLLKTMLKNGNAVTIKPYTRSSAQILFRTDRDAVGWQAAAGTMDIFDWEDIDFSRFTFNANDTPQEIPIRRKVKNYKRLQILVKNAVLDECFGIFGITKHFVVGNLSKT